MENRIIQKTSAQDSEYEFRPSFAIALEREKSSERPASIEADKNDLSDSFGSWFEWD